MSSMSTERRRGRGDARGVIAVLAAALAVVAQLPDVWRAREAAAAALSGLRGEVAARDAADREGRAVRDSLVAFVSATRARDSLAARPYLVVSLTDRRLWLRRGETVLFETPVATGRGDSFEAGTWRFATPRGRLIVERKEVDPLWIAPDWHYEEMAEARGLRLVRVRPGRPIALPDGGSVRVRGADVVRRGPDGQEVPYPRGREIVVGDRLFIPPFGTNQRAYPDVLGVNRLYLGEGYGIHGTDDPGSIGQAVTHGCIRVRNDAMAALFALVPVGTPVYIY